MKKEPFVTKEQLDKIAQEYPQSYSFKIFIKNGFGVAFTAKYSLYPSFQENASFNAFTFARIPFSSYR